MRVLVTGGAGYIGSHTAQVLASRGYEPVVLDNLSTGNAWAVRWGPFVRGDLQDAEIVESALREYEIGAVVHFAAKACAGESMEAPQAYFHNNVNGTLSLLKAMLAVGLNAIVFSSTCATYGNPVRTPIQEDHPQCPVNPYGDSKLFIEKALGWYEKAYGLKWIALRYFNAAGADPEGQLGEDHTPETHLIPLAIQAALEQRPALEIFGANYATPDGTAVRDYVHVRDLADAHLSALEYLQNGGSSAAFNLGSGTGYSVREVIREIERVSGRKVPAHEAPRRPGDPPMLVADATRARSALNWHPAHSDLASIVRSAWMWHSSGIFTMPRRAVG